MDQSSSSPSQNQQSIITFADDQSHSQTAQESQSESLANERQHSQSLPTSNQARTSLWKAVRTGINAAAALRTNVDDIRSRNRDNERIDEEGISIGDFHFRDSNQRPTSEYYSAKYADQWQNLAHLGINDSPRSDSNASSSRERRRRPTSANRRNPSNERRTLQSSQHNENDVIKAGIEDERTPRSPTVQDGTVASNPIRNSSKWKRFFSPSRSPSRKNHHSIDDPSLSTSQISMSRDQDSIAEEQIEGSVNEEPISFISNDPDQIPKGQDPLAYVNDDQHLLDSDSDTDSESEGGVHDQDNGGEQSSGNGNADGKKEKSLKKFKDKVGSLVPEMTSLRKGIREYT